MDHRKLLRRALLLTATSCAALPSIAASAVVSGYLNDPGNGALISSNGSDGLVAAQFAPDGLPDRNVAVYQLVVQHDGSAIRFTSSGYADGASMPDDGAQPYFSLFKGSDATAVFLDSSATDPEFDFSVSETLDAGTYLFTIGVYFNQSFAENNPSTGTLADGFTALAGSYALGNGFYQVDVTSAEAAFTVGPSPLTGSPGPVDPTSLPEPGIAALLGIGLLSCLRRGRNDAIRRFTTTAFARPSIA